MASTLTVKDMNQEIVRDCMKGLGPVSKSVLSRKTGLSFPTVSKTVDLLCETGEVEEAGTEKSGDVYKRQLSAAPYPVAEPQELWR